MNSAILTDVKSVAIDERERPAPDSDELLVEVNDCDVRTTHVHLSSGSFTGDYPIAPSHESASEVVPVGEEIDSYEASDRVVVNPSLQWCWASKAGRENLSHKQAVSHVVDTHAKSRWRSRQ